MRLTLPQASIAPLWLTEKLSGADQQWLQRISALDADDLRRRLQVLLDLWARATQQTTWYLPATSWAVVRAAEHSSTLRRVVPHELLRDGRGDVLTQPVREVRLAGGLRPRQDDLYHAGVGAGCGATA